MLEQLPHCSPCLISRAVMCACHSASATHPGQVPCEEKMLAALDIPLLLWFFCSWHSYPSILDYETRWCLRLFLIRRMGREMKGKTQKSVVFCLFVLDLIGFFFNHTPHTEGSLHPHKIKCTFWLNLNLSSPRGMIRKCFGVWSPRGTEQIFFVCAW